MRVLIIALFGVFLGIQFQLWYGAGGVLERRALSERVNVLENQMEEAQNRNRELRHSLDRYKPGSPETLSKIEIYARRDLGFIKENETFYWIVEAD